MHITVKNGSMVVYSQNGFLFGSKNECAISTGKRMNEFHKHDDEWKSNTKQYKLYDFIYKKQVTVVLSVRSQVDVYLWCGIMTGKTLVGTFWDAGDISLLDLGTNDSGVFTIENSLNYTFSFLYVPYTSIYTFTHFKANYRQFFLSSKYKLKAEIESISEKNISWHESKNAILYWQQVNPP